MSAAKVQNAIRAGDVVGAQRASRRVVKLLWASALAYIALFLIIIIVYLIGHLIQQK
jgi:hypothetical protein